MVLDPALWNLGFLSWWLTVSQASCLGDDGEKRYFPFCPHNTCHWLYSHAVFPQVPYRRKVTQDCESEGSGLTWRQHALPHAVKPNHSAVLANALVSMADIAWIWLFHDLGRRYQKRGDFASTKPIQEDIVCLVRASCNCIGLSQHAQTVLWLDNNFPAHLRFCAVEELIRADSLHVFSK